MPFLFNYVKKIYVISYKRDTNILTQTQRGWGLKAYKLGKNLCIKGLKRVFSMTF